MRTIFRLLITALAAVQLTTLGLHAQALYQIDNNTFRLPSGLVNASDGTEPRDNWFGNVFTAISGANLINRVDFGVYTTAPGSVASVSLYKVTGAGGNPALGATRLYTQPFTPLTGTGTNTALQSIDLTSPVALNVGDQFLVSILIRNVIANPPNDVYPYIIDNSGSSSGSYWGRSDPNLFNIDNLSGVVQTDTALSLGGFVPGPGHTVIRAFGIAVPEPSALALSGLGVAALAVRSRKNPQINGK